MTPEAPDRAIRERHTPRRGWTGMGRLAKDHCRACSQPWPCDAQVLLDRLDKGLDAAWAEAEEALPDGWAINLLWGTVTDERWGANAGPWPSKPGDSQTFAGGDSPAEALQALAAALRSRP